MRILPLAVLSVFMLASLPVAAGGVSIADDGKITWQSKWCMAPTPPPSLVKADRHTAADDMNVLVTQYNQYVGLMQIYMDCMSNEAQNDANSAAKEIVDSGATAIAAVKADMEKLSPAKAEKQ